MELLNAKFLGKGHNGSVYLLPSGNVIKICYTKNDFVNEAFILERVNGNKYFPMLYEIGGNYMIREYVAGEPLNKYIKKNGLSREICIRIIEMLKEFEKLKFTKIDIRCKDIFIQPNHTVRVIDPQKFFSKKRDFPRHLCKGLYKLMVLDYFLEVLHEYDPKLYKRWIRSIKHYLTQAAQNEKGLG